MLGPEDTGDPRARALAARSPTLSLLEGWAQTRSFSTQVSLLPFSTENDPSRCKREPPPPTAPRTYRNPPPGPQGPVFSDLSRSCHFACSFPPPAPPTNVCLMPAVWHHGARMHGTGWKTTETGATEPHIRSSLVAWGFLHSGCTCARRACTRSWHLLCPEPHGAGSTSLAFLLH